MGCTARELADYNADMSTVSIQDLQRDPLSLVLRVEAGESIVVTRDDRPIVELRPAADSRPALPSLSAARPYGLAAGEFIVPADFDGPLPNEILQDFEGR